MTYPSGSFVDVARVHQASPTLWTSEMFPQLEPYTAEHELFFRTLIDSTLGFHTPEAIKAQDCMPLAKDGLFILTRDFSYVWDQNGTFYRLTVPAGYVTDGASYPWTVQYMLRVNRTGYVVPAALAHDLTYQLKGLMKDVPVVDTYKRYYPIAVDGTNAASYSKWTHDPRPWPKSACDKFFLKVMNAYGTRLPKLTYWGVKYGGGLAYLGNDKSRFYTKALFKVEGRNGWMK